MDDVKKFLVQYFLIRLAKIFNTSQQQLRNYAYDSEMLFEPYLWEFAVKVWQTAVAHSERYEFLTVSGVPCNYLNFCHAHTCACRRDRIFQHYD